MKHRNRLASVGLAALMAAVAGAAQAAVSADEAKQLGTSLTLWGAEKAGSKDGLIPEYSGPVKVPASYDPKKPGVRPDPFASEKPLFVITAQNMDKYEDKLSEGQKAMLKKYPTFRIDVYPSHRTADYPKYVLDNTLKNATACKAVNNELQVEGCYGGVLFPIPKSGNQVIWNHVARYTAHSWGGTNDSVMVTASGKAINQGINAMVQEAPFFDPKRTGPAPNNTVYWQIRLDTSGPARKAGEKLMIIDALDTLNVGRRVYQYLPGQRRVKLAPDIAYDTPNPQAGGASVMDEAQNFMGAQDRFDFKLLGKKEMYIPYNNFKITDKASCSTEQLFTPNHANPDCVRWELHRVWVVAGTLKAGQRHVYSKRIIYVDEDAPGAGMAEAYDSVGRMYRFGFSTFYPMYEAQGMISDEFFVHDLTSGMYNGNGHGADYGGWYPIAPKPASFFNPDALAGEGVR
ncbi:DUF1329 domain-containing protein [Ferribacterium limneticum]|uniref:DUF1329 domain-containing protein n=1 Tax=Ferribacterium limneticum TaxID=76259 RepID=UPI001CF8C40F|nr:DUF1329 domain-containing protein [Ferribacterium limneticum]UCV23680.1 DUF1329 domain-containing protein [Ferribacterium limneticum]